MFIPNYNPRQNTRRRRVQSGLAVLGRAAVRAYNRPTQPLSRSGYVRRYQTRRTLRTRARTYATYR